MLCKNVWILLAVACLLSSTGSAQTDIVSGRYSVAVASFVTAQGGLAGDTRIYGITGEIKLLVEAGGDPEAAIIGSKLQIRGSEDLLPFPLACDLLPLTDLIGTITAEGSVVLSEPETEQQQVELSLSPTAAGLRLDGFYDEGCCDRYRFTFVNVQLIPDSSSFGIYLPGVAHTAGVAGSLWRSDVALFNPEETQITVEVAYMSDAIEAAKAAVELTLMPDQTVVYQDVVAMLAPDAGDSMGYLYITSSGGAPLVTGSTYNQDVTGTYGQGLVPFTLDSCTPEGDSAYLVGLTSWSAGDEGYRSNVGLLNTATETEARVWLILDTHLSGPSRAKLYTLSPGQLLQRNVFRELGVEDHPQPATVRVEVEQGGPVAAYGSIVNATTQDPVLVTPQASTSIPQAQSCPG
jgi:hypothetical protein